MKHRLPSLTLFVLALAAGLHGANGTAAKALAAANDAWERGDYSTALGDYIKLLESPGGEAMLEPIALQSGELFTTRELTADGRNPRFSPDARFIGFETGLDISRRTRIVRNDATLSEVADLPGVSATFSSTGQTVAYLKLTSDPALVAAAKMLDDAPPTAENRTALLQALAWQVLRGTAITVRDLASGQERELHAPGLLKSNLTFAEDGRTLYFLGGREGQDDQNDIFSIAEGGAPQRVGDATGLKGAPVVAAGGEVLLYTVGIQNPFRKPQPGQGGGGFAAGQQRPPSFGVVDLATNKTTTIEGAAPSLSTDGKTLAYLARAGAEFQLMVGPPRGPLAAVKKTTERLDAPALAPDGQRIAYQLMPRDDWEICLLRRICG